MQVFFQVIFLTDHESLNGTVLNCVGEAHVQFHVFLNFHIA